MASGLCDGKYSFSSRFEEEPGTNPEEVIAAGEITLDATLAS